MDVRGSMGIMTLPKTTPIAVLDMEHVWAALKGLEAGRYLSRDLYARYEAVARAAGQEPVHRVRFGQAVGATGAEIGRAHV